MKLPTTEFAKPTETRPVEAEAKGSTPKKVVARNAEAGAARNRRAAKEAGKLAAAEARRGEKERSEAAAIAASRAEQLLARQRKAEKESAEIAAARTRQTEKELLAAATMARQEQSAEEKARQREKIRAKRDAAISRFDEKQKTKLAIADEKITERLTKAKLRKQGKEQRALARAELRRASLNERLARAETGRMAKDARLADRAASKAERDLAKGGEQEEKPAKIRDKKSAYWTVEPGVALSLPSSSGGGGDSGGEKALEGVTFQALAGYHRAGGLSFRTGFALSRINSRVEAETTRPGTQSEEAIVAIIVSPNGARSEQRGTVQVATTETTTTKYYNSVTSVDIPLLIGYRFGGNKWGLMVEAGPTFNLSSGGEAHRHNGTAFALVGSDYFRKKLEGTGFLVNFGGAYRLTEKTSVTANLRFQGFGGGGFENPDVAPVSTNYSLLGIQLGYRIRF